jgi:hypothetical protein
MLRGRIISGRQTRIFCTTDDVPGFAKRQSQPRRDRLKHTKRQSSINSNPMKRLVNLSLFLLLSLGSYAQVPYAFMPPPRTQFVDANGVPLAGGFLYSYSAGTSTPAATYHLDTLGNITPNQNPIILDSTGSAEVRLAPQAYKFVLQNSSHVQIWAIDQVEDVGQVFYGQAVLLNPVAEALQTIAGPLSVTSLTVGGGTPLATTNQSGTGSLCLTTDCQLAFPIINGVGICCTPGAYFNTANATTPGTSPWTLTKLTGSPTSSVVIASTSDTGGIIGICTPFGGLSTCSTSGLATIQQSGNTDCYFDGTPTPGDYIQISSTVAGECHDAGSSYPTSGQIVGRVISSSGSNPYLIDLFGPELQSPFRGATASITVGPGAGTSASASCHSTCTDSGGQVQVNTGSAPPSVGAIFSVTFGAPHMSANCTISPASESSATFLTTVWPLANTAQLTLETGASLAGTSQYFFAYTCSFT